MPRFDRVMLALVASVAAMVATQTRFSRGDVYALPTEGARATVWERASDYPLPGGSRLQATADLSIHSSSSRTSWEERKVSTAALQLVIAP